MAVARKHNNHRGSDPSGERYVAFLRGINVGGKNLLPMQRLARIFEALGCRDVRTYIQSGNVMFAASATLPPRVPRLIEQAILAEAGLDVPVLVRSAKELATVARTNPFQGPPADPKSLHVAFLARIPTAAQVATLDPQRSPPDEFVVAGREIYLRLPFGVARTRLTNAYFDSKLGTVSTLRGIGTIEKLLELCRA
jgi:uncharacterized protein (DUF1697 family)